MNTIQIAPPTCEVVFDRLTDYVDRSLATASWWDKYEILPGAYPFEWVNINHRPWNADPEAHTAGYLANIGPYYALVRLRARLVAEYRVNRLLAESSSDYRVHHENEPETLTRTVYAYQIPGCPKGERGRLLTEFMGGVVRRIEVNA